MAQISYLYRGKKDNGKLSIRLIHTKEIDYRVVTPIISKRSYWYNKKGKHRKYKELRFNIEVQNHQKELDRFANLLLGNFHTDFNNGVPITKVWLREQVEKIMPMINQKEHLKNQEEKLRADQKKERDLIAMTKKVNLLEDAINEMIVKYQINTKEQRKYKVILNRLKDFQEYKGEKFKLRDLNQKFADAFISWGKAKNYKDSYINTMLKRIRSAVGYAYENDEKGLIDISRQWNRFKMIKITNKNKIVVHLDYEELDQIDLTKVDDLALIDAKKAILIGCETALRYSDFNKLIEDNLITMNDGRQFWEFRTNKTDRMVRIPKSERLKYIMGKYGIPKMNYADDDIQLNRDIKSVCRLAKIKKLTKGEISKSIKIDGNNERRLVQGEYPKYQLITTRTFRRSFATNYYGQIDIDVVMGVTGHSTEKMLREYLNLQDERKVDKAFVQIDEFHKTRKKSNSDLMKIVK